MFYGFSYDLVGINRLNELFLEYNEVAVKIQNKVEEAAIQIGKDLINKQAIEKKKIEKEVTVKESRKQTVKKENKIANKESKITNQKDASPQNKNVQQKIVKQKISTNDAIKSTAIKVTEIKQKNLMNKKDLLENKEIVSFCKENIENAIRIFQTAHLKLFKLIVFYKKQKTTRTSLKGYNNDELRKTVRNKKIQIRELEMKLKNEIALRKNAEMELERVRKDLRTVKTNMDIFDVNVHSVSNEIALCVGKYKMLLNADFIEFHSVCYSDSSVPIFKQHKTNMLVEEIKNHELHTISERTRRLAVKITILGNFENVVTENTKSKYEIEEEIRKEKEINKGILKIMAVVSGKMVEECKKQLEGSNLKLNELNEELSRCNINSPQKMLKNENCDKLYEFNNHGFKRTKMTREFCYVCNELLYGSEGYKCNYCDMWTHPSCYTLVKVSCELYIGIKKGTNVLMLMRSKEEKSKFINRFRDM